MLPKADLLKTATNRELAARLLDLAEQALRTWEVTLSDFLKPPDWAEAASLLGGLAELHWVQQGGYPQAERQRIAIARRDIPLTPADVSLAALDISGNFLFDSATHRDFLGAMLGTGIVREKVGDIIVLGERGAQAIVIPELADFLTENLTQVRSVPVKTQIIEFSGLKVREPRTKELTTVEASLRLDAIASAGFGTSRSKIADLITHGDVRVNWKTITNTSHQLQPGDLIALQGKGRLAIGEISITKKERYRIQMTRYL
jgi:photosystem II S4 domain protein